MKSNGPSSSGCPPPDSVIAHAVVVFGDEQKATHWLFSPLSLFKNQAPQDLVSTDEGLAMVEQTLSRIEHNIPS
jgi:putative toxin-antitoxin system antitoxin component (TIGR02293 family)